ncbi:MAG: hypothetical protein F4X11_25030 [Acidobacteria bacterium]|nr:hypothetical protein [Chloroflexota bacterium]MYN68241.1 hypothetical protein [Acidobacteriota bacterium]
MGRHAPILSGAPQAASPFAETANHRHLPTRPARRGREARHGADRWTRIGAVDVDRPLLAPVG